MNKLNKINKSPQILRSSFSSVWTATIARVGAFFSVFRDLQDLHSFNISGRKTTRYNSGDFEEKNLHIFESGAVQRIANLIKSCRSRKIWKNAPTLAIVAADTAENERFLIFRFSTWFSYPIPTGTDRRARTAREKPRPRRSCAELARCHFARSFQPYLATALNMYSDKENS